MRRRTLLAVIAALTVAITALPNSGTARSVKESDKPGLFMDFYPPAPFAIVVKQPDGTTFRGKLQPKEIGGHLETTDGYAVVKDEATGWWYYAERAQGAKLFASKRAVGKASPAGLKVGLGRHDDIWKSTKLGSMRDQTLRMLQMASWKAQMKAAETGQLPYVFHTPFFLFATWYDESKGQTSPQFQPGHDVEFFTKMLDGFGGNPTGTMTEFWLENSYGQFLVDVDVYGPYTSYRSLNDPCYYGNTNNEYQEVNGEVLEVPGIGPIPRLDDGDPVGNFLGIGGLGAAGMAIELTPQADPDVDFGKYDNDNDGKVDFLGIIHSGPDMAATGDPCQTWSHAFEVEFVSGIIPPPLGPEIEKFGGMPTSDRNAEGEPVVVDRVFTMPEIDANIGVAVHEMMHARGEPDYYNTSYTSSGTGDWDIMAGGSWFGNPPGTNPLGANPATRVFQGWVTPRVVHDDLRNVKIAPREIMPKPGYNVTMVDPNIVLVPTAWTDSTDPVDVYGLPKDPKNGKFITEGWYIEHISRSVNAPPIHEGMTRSPYFDRYAYSSGLIIWHFDYYKKSNVYTGANDGQTDPNRPQLDPEEFDFGDNTQELQLNYNRGEPSDLWFGAATGMTAATRRNPPGIPNGKPSDGVEGTGVTPPGTQATHEFTVPNNPANYYLRARTVGQGDCTLELEFQEGDEWISAGSVDSGFVAEEETLTVTKPKPGPWRIIVGDFAACGPHEWGIRYELPFFTTGAADTWTNLGKNTGWAFTNIGPANTDALEHSADAPGPEAITLDILKIGAKESDVSPGFVSGADTSTFGSMPINAGRASKLTVPVHNNGGRGVRADVEVRLGSATGPAIASASMSLPGYSRQELSFNWTPAVEGKHDLYTVVDPANAIVEASEANNVQKSRLVVGPANPTVLVVDDEGSNDFEETYAGALTAAGVPWAIAKGHVDAKTMAQYKAVIWEAGLDRYQGQLNDLDRREISKYLDGGGRMWMTSTRLAAAMGGAPGPTNPGATPDMPAFLRDYFGAVHVDTLQVGGGAVVGQGDDSGIGGKRTIATDVLPGRPLQDVWTIAAGDNASKKGTVSPIFKYPKGGEGDHQGVRVVGDDAHKGFRTVNFGFNLRQVVLGAEQVRLTTEVMKYLGVQTGVYKPAVPLLWHSQERTRVSGQAAPLVVYAFNMPAPKLRLRVHGGSSWDSYPMRQDAPNVYQGIVLREWVTPRGVDYFIEAAIPDPSGAPHLAHYIGVGMPNRGVPAKKPR